LSLRHFDLRPTIPEDRTRGGGRLDRRNDQIGSDTDVPGVAVLYDDHSFDRTGAGTAYGISVAQQGRDVWHAGLRLRQRAYVRTAFLRRADSPQDFADRDDVGFGDSGRDRIIFAGWRVFEP